MKYYKEIKIAKYNMHPKEDPIGYAVGFEVTLHNGRRLYKDTLVPFDPTIVTDEDIVKKAWDIVKHNIKSQSKLLGISAPLVGHSWSPPFDPEDLIDDDQGTKDQQDTDDSPGAENEGLI